MRNSKKLSVVIILLTYIIAAIGAMITFKLVPYQELWVKILAADIIATIIVYVIGCLFQNASLYDPYWSVAPPFIMGALMIMNNDFSFGSMIVLVIITLWAIRLTYNWFITFKNLNHQDWRYSMLKEKSGKSYPFINFLGIHLFPTLIVYGVMLPIILFLEGGFGTNILDSFGKTTLVILGCSISLIAIFIQWRSDCQMQAFRRNPNNKNKYITTGLWKYSRHPNYLGEIMMWWGVFIATGLVNNPFLFIGPLLNTLMFLFVSIPMAENRLRRYKEGYDEYVAETRMLLPFSRKS
ncbi:MAG: DUF1295 domain-containing protein [Bacilli bacterium]|nr:DUF1295 domain-containing protein [Bacilli bacterium]